MLTKILVVALLVVYADASNAMLRRLFSCVVNGKNPAIKKVIFEKQSHGTKRRYEVNLLDKQVQGDIITLSTSRGVNDRRWRNLISYKPLGEPAWYAVANMRSIFLRANTKKEAEARFRKMGLAAKFDPTKFTPVAKATPEINNDWQPAASSLPKQGGENVYFVEFLKWRAYSPINHITKLEGIEIHELKSD